MARINLLMITKDMEYAEKFSAFFSLKHSSEIVFYTLSGAAHLKDFLAINRVDVALIQDGIEADLSDFREKTVKAYLIENEYTDEINGCKTICMYQKAERIYKMVLELYAEESKAVIGAFHTEGQAKTIAFTSSSGGSGATTVSVAFSRFLAARGKKVFYFGFDMLPSYNLYFKGDNLGTMSDVLYALKSSSVNLNVKLRGLINTDKYGISFFESFAVAADVLDLGAEDVGRLVDEVKKIDNYDYFLFDFNFFNEKTRDYFFGNSSSVIIVCEDTQSSLEKYRALMPLLEYYEQNSGISFMDRLSVVANKNKNIAADALGERCIGSIEKVGGIKDDEIADYISVKHNEIFARLAD